MVKIGQLEELVGTLNNNHLPHLRFKLHGREGEFTLQENGLFDPGNVDVAPEQVSSARFVNIDELKDTLESKGSESNESKGSDDRTIVPPTTLTK